MIQQKNVILLNSLWKFFSFIQRRLDFVYTACLAWSEASELNREFSYFPQLWLQEWGCNGLKNVTKGLRDLKEGAISVRKAGLLWGLIMSMKKSTLQVRLNRRVTFDRRIEVPSPSFF